MALLEELCHIHERMTLHLRPAPKRMKQLCKSINGMLATTGGFKGFTASRAY
ncbi:hypothetical protein ACSS6W_008137 [Trichoderma asperelloides]